MSNIGMWEKAEPGVTRCIKQAGDSLMMMEVHFEPGAEGYEHSHPHEQMSYCMKGKIAFRINDVETVLAAGDTICIPSGAKHGVMALEASILLDVFTPVREDLLKR
ncbi:cupin domain-containing protein [Paenibacillus sp. YAF4_2]|uniref:cupin domain-containing protein n=1 Tax=Paenibacillus sp. YAF4_2 TaxID=3233085 RepID=UPI003F9A26ED